MRATVAAENHQPVECPPLPCHNDASDAVRGEAANLMDTIQAVDKSHASRSAAVDAAIFEIEKVTLSSTTWADVARQTVIKELRKISTLTLDTYTTAAEERRQAGEFAGVAIEVCDVLTERAADDGTKVREALLISEDRRVRENVQATEALAEERARSREEIERLRAALANEQRQSEAVRGATCSAMAVALKENEELVETVEERFRAALDALRDEHRKEVAMLNARNAASKLGRARDQGEKNRIIAQLNVSLKRTETSGAVEADTLRKSAEAITKQCEEQQKQIVHEQRRCDVVMEMAERECQERLAELDARRQREADLLAEEITRLRGAIKDALKPCRAAPGDAVADRNAFTQARQMLFYESLKAQLGVKDPSKAVDSAEVARRLAAANEAKLTWRGQRESLALHKPRMAFRSDFRESFGTAPPLPTHKRRPGSAASPRVRQARPATAAAAPTASTAAAESLHGGEHQPQPPQRLEPQPPPPLHQMTTTDNASDGLAGLHPFLTQILQQAHEQAAPGQIAGRSPRPTGRSERRGDDADDAIAPW